MDGNVEYFLFQGAIRITFLFFKSVYHMIQMIQSGSVSAHRCIFIKIYFKIFSIGKLTPVAIFKCFYSLNLKALKLTVKNLYQSKFFWQNCMLNTCNFIKGNLLCRYFTVYCGKVLRKPFLQKTSGRPLLPFAESFSLEQSITL